MSFDVPTDITTTYEQFISCKYLHLKLAKQKHWKVDILHLPCSC